VRKKESYAAFLEELAENERVLEDPLDRLDEDRAHVEAGGLRPQQLHSCHQIRK
jgi:hypothetical protein